MSLTPERVADIMNSSYAHEIPPVKALCEDWLELRKQSMVRIEDLEKDNAELQGALDQAVQMANDHAAALLNAEEKLAAMKRAIKASPHDSDCTYIRSLRNSIGRFPRTAVPVCDCWQSRVALPEDVEPT